VKDAIGVGHLPPELEVVPVGLGGAGEAAHRDAAPAIRSGVGRHLSVTR
jgi:hypothetical protein